MICRSMIKSFADDSIERARMATGRMGVGINPPTIRNCNPHYRHAHKKNWWAQYATINLNQVYQGSTR